MKAFFRRLRCLLLGHESAVERGYASPWTMVWGVPKKPTRPILPVIVGRQMPVSDRINVFTDVKESVEPHYQVDHCWRCGAFTLYELPPSCMHCHMRREVHDAAHLYACLVPCLHCHRSREEHFDDKCPFDSTTFLGTFYEVPPSSAGGHGVPLERGR